MNVLFLVLGILVLIVLVGCILSFSSCCGSVANVRSRMCRSRREESCNLPKRSPRSSPGASPRAGSRGPKGPTGSQGCPGPCNDERGPQGCEGPRGENGDRGPKGERGDEGDRGLDGPQGSRGARGSRGIRGSIGIQGPQGLKGKYGRKGQRGPLGVQGNQGSQGLVGASSIIIPFSSPNTIALTPTQDMRYLYSWGHGSYGLVRQSSLDANILYPDIQIQLPDRPVYLVRLVVTLVGNVGPTQKQPIATVPSNTGGLFFNILLSNDSNDVEFANGQPSVLFVGNDAIATARTEASIQAPVLVNDNQRRKIALSMRSLNIMPENASLDLNVSACLELALA
jgi:hypothetical protein